MLLLLLPCYVVAKSFANSSSYALASLDGSFPDEPVLLFVTGALTDEPTSAVDSILCASAT